MFIYNKFRILLQTAGFIMTRFVYAVLYFVHRIAQLWQIFHEALRHSPWFIFFSGNFVITIVRCDTAAY